MKSGSDDADQGAYKRADRSRDNDAQKRSEVGLREKGPKKPTAKATPPTRRAVMKIGGGGLARSLSLWSI